MAGERNFDKLVSELTLNERQGLLEKMKSQSTLPRGPLYFEDDKLVPAYDLEDEYSSLPWYYRLWYFILSFFKSKAPVKLFEEKSVSVLGIMVDQRSPGLYDYQKVMLLPGFYRQVLRLKEAAQFFYSALDSSVNRDKGGFFAFLGSLEMPDVHSRLQDGTSPSAIADKFPDMPEQEIRQMALRNMEDAFSMITTEYRNIMYFNARTLNCLKELSSFLYDRLLTSFHFNQAFGGETCSAGVVRDPLISLNNTLFSLKIIPPLTLLESLFIFILQERASEPTFDMNKETRSLLTKAEDALGVIREFNKQVPLTWILRCSTRKMSLAPKEISGGEDWFMIFKDYWKRRVDSLFSDYMKDRLERKLHDTFRTFLKGKSIKMLENTQSASNSDGLPIKEALPLSFLFTFYSAVFMPDINWILRSILVDGEWKAKENRVEFSEAYNNLVKLEDEIKKFEHEISMLGDYGKRFTLAKKDMSSLPVKRKKIQIVVEEASEDAKKILGQARSACESMVNILNGILGNDLMGKYETLANLSKMTTKGNNFFAGLNEATESFRTVIKILNDMDAVGYGR